MSSGISNVPFVIKNNKQQQLPLTRTSQYQFSLIFNFLHHIMMPCLRYIITITYATQKLVCTKINIRIGVNNGIPIIPRVSSAAQCTRFHFYNGKIISVNENEILQFLRYTTQKRKTSTYTGIQ